MNVKSILWLFFCLLITPKLIFAHGGHKEEKSMVPLTEETTSLNNSIYSVDVEEDVKFPAMKESLLNSPFSSINSLSGDASLVEDINTGDPMKRFKEKTHSVEQHDQHKTQHVEESSHEWVSPSVKGHKVALTITAISGLAFIGLSFFRIGEKTR